MLVWLIPVGLFWTLAALYLGGMSVDVEGGSGFRQIVGLLATFVLFLAAWGVLRALLGGMGAVVGGIVVPTAASAVAMPLLARAGFRVVGVRVRRVAGSH